MYYSELLNFESLESVIEIRDANNLDKAKHLVKTFVFSDELADRLINLVFIQLQLYHPSDNKGLFIVGNYGTGKSHLMAVLSSLAENAELITYLQHPEVAATAATFAGQFYVLRTEIGATTRSLRDIVTSELENYLGHLGVIFKFPSAAAITNNKEALEAMMVVFEEHYPNLGLLLVVDELLDYLRTRKDQELFLDLSFLRELGEVCKHTKFRLIAGIQETIFDSPRFSFVADSLRRVKDRFEQLLITRNDIKFVVAQRLLKKTKTQYQKIQQYLSQFTPCYGHLTERLEEFCQLFPVHPDYIDTFERITLIEKREILKTIERECQAKLHQAVPEQSLELIAYDSYWHTLRQNPSFRSLPEIREVIECSQVLEHRIQQAFTLPLYQSLAIRIIHGLSVHRLTTHDIYAPVGVTAQELRDSLCLYQTGVQELGGEPAEDLLTIVEMTLTEIVKTVNRQFISTNPSNGQYYLDVRKNYDLEALIEKRADSLEFHQLDRSYYVALRQLLEVTEQPTLVNNTTGSWAWQYELEWRTHRVTRLGLLVFGTPHERPITPSPRDFYLYFLPSEGTSSLSNDNHDNPRNSELLFRVSDHQNKCRHWLRIHAAATELMTTSSEPTKTSYAAKQQEALQHLIDWLSQNLLTAFEVTYQGRTDTILKWLKTRLTPTSLKLDEVANFRDGIELVANVCLERYFTEMAPEYPHFPILVSQDNLTALAQEAVRQLNRQPRSKLATGILEGLELLDDDHQLNPQHSKYARAIVELLYQRPEGQVLNRSELLQDEIDMSYFAPQIYRLEPELVMVLLAALVSSKEIVLTLGGQTFDASQLETFANFPLTDLLYFRYIDRPKGLNLSAVTALFELLGLPLSSTALTTPPDEQVMRPLHNKIREDIQRFIQVHRLLLDGFLCWGQPLFSATELQHYQNLLAHTKDFLESLQAFTTLAKFRNFRYAVEEIQQHDTGFAVLQNLTALQTFLIEVNQPMAYLSAAATALPTDHSWQAQLAQNRESLCAQLAALPPSQLATFSYPAKQQLIALQKEYVKAYLKLHHQARLGVMEDKEKTRLSNDYRLLNLRQLARIDWLPRQSLQDFETRLQQLRTCYELSEYDLNTQTICPHCGFQPQQEVSSPPALTELAQLNKRLRLLHTDWTQLLLTELTHTQIPQDLLAPEKLALLETFLHRHTLPEPMTEEFLAAIQEGLAGLVKVVIKTPELFLALSADGLPVTISEIRQRFEDYLQKLTPGQDLSKIRVRVE